MTLEEIAHGIRGGALPHQPLDQSLPALIRELNLSPEIERVYAAQILLKTGSLYLQYTRLLALLPYI